MTFNLKREWISLIAIAAMFITSFVFYNRLPDPMPIHWNVSGQPDDFAARPIGAFVLPLSAIGIYLLLYFIPLLDPKRHSLERSADTYILLRNLVVLFLLFMHALTLYSVLQGGQDLSTAAISLGLGVMFMAIGNYMPRMKPSWIAGIRTPWTLSSETVWTQTHRFGGRMFVLGGLIACISAFLPPVISATLLISAILVAAFVPVAYSYLLWRREQGA